METIKLGTEQQAVYKILESPDTEKYSDIVALISCTKLKRTYPCAAKGF